MIEKQRRSINIPEPLELQITEGDTVFEPNKRFSRFSMTNVPSDELQATIGHEKAKSELVDS